MPLYSAHAVCLQTASYRLCSHSGTDLKRVEAIALCRPVIVFDTKPKTHFIIDPVSHVRSTLKSLNGKQLLIYTIAQNFAKMCDDLKSHSTIMMTPYIAKPYIEFKDLLMHVVFLHHQKKKKTQKWMNHCLWPVEWFIL